MTLRKSLCEQHPVLSWAPSTHLERSWGESAGAISVALHMMTNKGNQEGLFRGAIMQSGGPIPVGDIENGQQYYDFMVERTGCSNAADTLDCLRKVSYPTFKKAMDESPNFFAHQARIYDVAVCLGASLDIRDSSWRGYLVSMVFS